MKRGKDEETLIDECLNLDKRAAHNMVNCVPYQKALKPAPLANIPIPRADPTAPSPIDSAAPIGCHSLAIFFSLHYFYFFSYLICSNVRHDLIEM